MVRIDFFRGGCFLGSILLMFFGDVIFGCLFECFAMAGVGLNQSLVSVAGVDLVWFRPKRCPNQHLCTKNLRLATGVIPVIDS